MMLALTAFLIFTQASPEELDKIARRFNETIPSWTGDASPEVEDARKAVVKAGPQILPHLAKLFPGNKDKRRYDCPPGPSELDSRYPLVHTMVFSFRDEALPFLLVILKGGIREHQSIAACAMRHYPSERIVGPLIDFGDLTLASPGLAMATFRRFQTLKEWKDWRLASGSRSRAEWLLEAIDAPGPETVDRMGAVQAIPHVLQGRAQLDALYRACLDKSWNEARYALASWIGLPGAKGRDLDRIRRECERFRKMSVEEQNLEIVLRGAGPGLFTPDERDRFLFDHADKALEKLEQLAESEREPFRFADAFSCLMSDTNFDRAIALSDRLAQNPRPGGTHRMTFFEEARHPRFPHKMLDLMLEGTLGPRNCFTWILPRRVTADMVPRLLEGLAKAEGPLRKSLIDSLAVTGDPRGWELVKKEVFDRPGTSRRSATLLEYYNGHAAMEELDKLLDSTDVNAFALAARILADRGDNAGIALMMSRLPGELNETSAAILLWRLSEARGMAPGAYKRSEATIKNFTEWWERNKDKPRTEWLLESLVQVDLRYPPPRFRNYGLNPLAFIAKDELKGIRHPFQEEYNVEGRRRIREWIERTKFTFNPLTPRLRYGVDEERWPATW